MKRREIIRNILFFSIFFVKQIHRHRHTHAHSQHQQAATDNLGFFWHPAQNMHASMWNLYFRYIRTDMLSWTQACLPYHANCKFWRFEQTTHTQLWKWIWYVSPLVSSVQASCDISLWCVGHSWLQFCGVVTPRRTVLIPMDHFTCLFFFSRV